MEGRQVAGIEGGREKGKQQLLALGRSIWIDNYANNEKGENGKGKTNE